MFTHPRPSGKSRLESYYKNGALWDSMQVDNMKDSLVEEERAGAITVEKARITPSYILKKYVCLRRALRATRGDARMRKR